MNVDPSSLIFVVIVGIWAVYLLQHWVRRREQLATSRSIDRFSEAMRVLERRAPIPVALPTSQNRPYVVAPAQPSLAAQVSQPSQASNTERRPEVDMKQALTPRNDRPAAAGGQAGRPHVVETLGRTGGGRTDRRTHRVRGLILLALLVGTPACWAAHIWGTLLLSPTLIVSVLLVLDLLFVRSVVRRAAAHRRAAQRRTTAHGSPGRAASRPRPAQARAVRARSAQTFPAAPAAATAAARSSTLSSTASSTASSSSRSATALAERPATQATSTVHSQDAITEVIVLEGGWEPVAVPPPTYTMKAKAERAPEASAVLEPESDSAPAREPVQSAIAIDELDLDAVLDRRRAAGE